MSDIDKDVAAMARGKEVKYARAVLEEHCSKRQAALIGKILKQLRNPDSGPLSPEQAIQGWLELAAIASLQSDLEKQIMDGQRASGRVVKSQK